MKKGKTMMIKIVMMKNITTKENPINTKEENILKKSFYSRKDNGLFEESDQYIYDINKEEFFFMAMDTKSTNI
jgi:hypothetical protein